MVEYLLIIISAIFVNNILLSQFLGICPFLGVSNKLSTATGMSMAVCFVITLATVVTYKQSVQQVCHYSSKSNDEAYRHRHTGRCAELVGNSEERTDSEEL